MVGYGLLMEELVILVVAYQLASIIGQLELSHQQVPVSNQISLLSIHLTLTLHLLFLHLTQLLPTIAALRSSPLAGHQVVIVVVAVVVVKLVNIG